MLGRGATICNGISSKLTGSHLCSILFVSPLNSTVQYWIKEVRRAMTILVVSITLLLKIISFLIFHIDQQKADKIVKNAIPSTGNEHA
jgi:hypothetical protein